MELIAGGVGHMGGLTTPTPGAEDAVPVILISVGFSCLKKTEHIFGLRIISVSTAKDKEPACTV